MINQLENHFLKLDKNIVISKCKENDCRLKDIKKEEYLTLDGDGIFKHQNIQGKSVDCIVVNRKTESDGSYKIIFCELSSGDKSIKTLHEKFKNSAKHMLKTCKEIGINSFNIILIYLGKLKQNGKRSSNQIKTLKKPIRIEGYEKPCEILNESCDFSINEL